MSMSTPTETSPGLRYPAATAGRTILDQHGDVYLMRTFSSWAMAQQLSNDEIDPALVGVAANGFNAVSVWIGGGYDIGAGWNRYTNAAGEPFWTGAPWRSDLGPGWSSVDHIVEETGRLGLAVNLSFAGAWGDQGAGQDWEKATDEEMYAAGAAIASRYRSYPHVIWHVMFDYSTAPSSIRGQRIDALFHGINDTEGSSARPVRWAEPYGHTTTYRQLIDVTPGFSYLNLTLNGWYDADTGNAADLVEATCAEVDMPVGDVEPAYDGSGHYPGDEGQQLRERSYATFLEGGSYINYGHEDWWPFGAAGLYTEGLSWQEVPSDIHTVQQSYVWALLDAYRADPTWEPNSAFVVRGEGQRDWKAAIGASDSAALAYFPSTRDVVVDTTLIGKPSVRLRWYDPTSGTFMTIADAESPNPTRALGFPGAHSDGTQDWVLVLDEPDRASR